MAMRYDVTDCQVNKTDEHKKIVGVGDSLVNAESVLCGQMLIHGPKCYT